MVDWAFLIFVVVVMAFVSILVFWDGGSPASPPVGLTKEEEEIDAIAGEMWRQMGE